LITEAKDLALVDAVDFLLVNARDFNDGRKWHGKKPASHAEEQGLNARESERRAKLKSGAASFLRGNVNSTLQFVENAPHYIHANAAARDLRDFSSRAET
jgi:hypothetical protein